MEVTATLIRRRRGSFRGCMWRFRIPLPWERVLSRLEKPSQEGKIADRDVKVVSIGGDGGSFDIGFQAISGAMERGHT